MQVTGNYSYFYGETMLPSIRAMVGRGYGKRPVAFKQLFNVNSSTKSLEQFVDVSGVGRFRKIAQGGKIGYDQPVQGFKSSFTHTRFGLAVGTSRDVVEDDNFSLINKMHMDLGWSCSETREIDASSTFNNAFSGSYLGPDGVSLCSASHPLYKAGGLQSNLMSAADLDMYSLRAMLIAFQTQHRPSGELIHVAASKLLVAPANQFVAYSLTKSTDDPTTADRSINPLNATEDGMPTTFVYRYLTNDNAWFLVAQPEDTGLVWFDRKVPYTNSWTDDETEVGVIGMRYKKSHGWNDYIGVVGNQGT